MRKLIVGLVAVLAVAAIFAGSAASRGDGGKLIDSGFACGLLDGNGAVFVTNNTERWLYQSQVILRCRGTGAAGPPPHPKFFNFGNTGLSCSIGGGYGVTTDWSDKVGYNGDSQLTCKLGLNDPASTSDAGAGLG